MPRYTFAKPLYTLREGCEAPVQPRLKNDDFRHPRFNEYMRYRDAMNAQLVNCPSFKNWLGRAERDYDY